VLLNFGIIQNNSSIYEYHIILLLTTLDFKDHLSMHPSHCNASDKWLSSLRNQPSWRISDEKLRELSSRSWQQIWRMPLKNKRRCYDEWCRDCTIQGLLWWHQKWTEK